MPDFEELNARTEDLLTRPANGLPVRPPEAATAAGRLEGLGAAEAQQFTTFRPSHQKMALALTRRFMELANARPGPDGLAEVLAEAERATQRENSELVKYALLVFITHHPEGRRLPIPPLEERAPQAVLPSRRAAPGGLEALGALGPEAQLDYFREDIAVNDHHNKWHIVYPGDGHPDPNDPFGPTVHKDRQGELFWYMHQQMLARYDAERAAVGLPPVVPLSDYRAGIEEGYEANLPGFSNRVPDAVLQDIEGYAVSDHELRRDRLVAATQEGFLRRNGGQVPIDPVLLGNTQEANFESVEGENWSDPFSFYGQHHNFGHVLIAALADPDGPFPDRNGVMISTSTAVRDPVFYRWHRHVDDIFAGWQETLAPNDLAEGAPPVRIRKALGGGAEPEAASPDILLAFAAGVPGAGEAGFDGQAFAEATFGGDHFDEPPASFPMLTDELRTRMGEILVRQRDGSLVPSPFRDHEEFFYFLRLENLSDEAQQVTVRMFLVPRERAEERRAWIEMDKFAQSLAARQRAVVFRPARLSAVVRKPARRPTEPRPARPPGTADRNYCDCGWPYHLLLPRGTEEGMDYRLLVMLTDAQLDLVGAEKKCGSMSFCGARDALYPDRRRMGYPFDRPFGDTTIAQAIAARPNMAARDLKIRHVAP